MNWIIFLDWVQRIATTMLMGSMVVLLPLWAWHEFDRPDAEYGKIWYGLDWAFEIGVVGIKLGMACFFALLTFLIPQHKSEWREKREGQIVACPTCGHDYHPKKP